MKVIGAVKPPAPMIVSVWEEVAPGAIGPTCADVGMMVKLPITRIVRLKFAVEDVPVSAAVTVNVPTVAPGVMTRAVAYPVLSAIVEYVTVPSEKLPVAAPFGLMVKVTGALPTGLPYASVTSATRRCV